MGLAAPAGAARAPDSVPIRGYEIHCGVTTGAGLAAAPVQLDDGRMDGARSADGQVVGTYLHGLFDAPEALAAWLRWAGLRDAARIDVHALREASIDRLADVVEAHLDTRKLATLMGLHACKP